MSCRILLLSYYFPPDLGAGAFRVGSLVSALMAKAPDDTTIEVITTQPNRYSSLTRRACRVEKLYNDRVIIRRVQLPKFRRGTIGQIFAYIWFFLSVFRLTLGCRYELVFATSSRLFTALLGVVLSKFKAEALYLDVRDLFSENLESFYTGIRGRILSKFFSALEFWAVAQADKVNLVSPGFLEYYASRFPEGKFSLFTNGIDTPFLRFDFHKVAYEGRTPRKLQRILYAGNIGKGQELESIIPTLADRFPDIEFVVIGDGDHRPLLESRLQELKIKNVVLRDPVKRDELLGEYREADVLFIHLGRSKSLRYVLPSKLFEFAATGKPILAGVNGFPKKFLDSSVDNCVTFLPGDVEGAVLAMEKLTLDPVPRSEFKRVYNRELIMAGMAVDVLTAAGQGKLSCL